MRVGLEYHRNPGMPNINIFARKIQAIKKKILYQKIREGQKYFFL
jgi:hypothetical protein